MSRKLAVGVVAGALGLAGLFGGVALASSHSESGPAAFATDDPPTGTAAMGTDDRHGNDDSDRATKANVRDDLIPVAQAVDAAQARVPQGRVKEVELEWEHGRLVWSVELVADGTEYEVDVDAKTADVVRVEQDDDDDRDDRRHDDDRRDD